MPGELDIEKVNNRANLDLAVPWLATHVVNAADFANGGWRPGYYRLSRNHR